MDMRGDHRRPTVVEVPKRTPWLAIILIVLAVIAAWSVVSQLGLNLKLPAFRSEDGVADLVIIEEASEEIPDAPGQVASPVPPVVLPADSGGAPRWVTQPQADFPAEARSASGAVQLDCGIEADLTLGDCRVLSETPAGQGFAANAVEAAERARVSSGHAEGRRVTFTMRFMLPNN